MPYTHCLNEMTDQVDFREESHQRKWRILYDEKRADTRSDSHPKTKYTCNKKKKRSFEVHEIELLEIKAKIENSTTVIGKFNSSLAITENNWTSVRTSTTLRTSAARKTSTMQPLKRGEKIDLKIIQQKKINGTHPAAMGNALLSTAACLYSGLFCSVLFWSSTRQNPQEKAFLPLSVLSTGPQGMSSAVMKLKRSCQLVQNIIRQLHPEATGNGGDVLKTIQMCCRNVTFGSD